MTLHSTYPSVDASGKPASGDVKPRFWAGYWRSLKPLAVEEPIDVWVHRPLAYVLAKLLYPTRVSPNLVTFVSILFGIAAGAAMLRSSLSWHLQLAGACVFLSAIFDCADGQLARMRGTSSAFGRMLDGVADAVVSLAAVGGSTYVIWTHYNATFWSGAIAVALCVLTAVTGSFHTSMYDHYKNLYLKFTSERYSEGESYFSACERYRRGQNNDSIFAKLAWPIYLFYMRGQENQVHAYDPYTTARLDLVPSYTPESHAVYERHAARAMRVWKSFFGFGSLVFGISFGLMLNVLEWYMLARLVLQNAAFYLYLRPLQRRASRAAFAEIGLKLPDQAA
ncbi:MAG TPA: CDP-alcohol phosphatidyltransferase family protein [Polyangiales bacterium]|nr:CDP-alcohol phosphatidyltransferase family protein [Polyangiales bacterium]